MTQNGQTPVLIRVNYIVRVPGFAEFKSQDMRLDVTERKLMIRTPNAGILSFGEEEELQIQVLDLDAPTFLREQMVNQGWENMTLGRLVTVLYLTYLSEV